MPRFQPRTNDHDDAADMLDASPEADGSVCAIAENRAYEVGVACLRLADLTLEVAQWCDDQAYSKTISVLQRHEPRTLLLPPSAADSMLERVAANAFPDATVAHPNRKGWNELRGLEKVRHFSLRADLAALETAVASKYLALSALAALVDTVESSEHTAFVKGALKIRCTAVDGTMLLDAATIANLELLRNLRTGDPKV